MARALVNVPKTARRGEVIEVKVLLAHPMETGFRPGPDGAVLPRNIVERLVCTYNGQTIGAIGLVKAAHLYWRAQSVYQIPTSKFPDHADALEASCTDLIGQPLNALSTSGPGGPSGAKRPPGPGRSARLQPRGRQPISRRHHPAARPRR